MIYIYIYICCHIDAVNNRFSAVGQYYEAQVYDMFVIRGNTAIFKCSVPSFVSDYVHVESWEATNGDKYFMPNVVDSGRLH